MYWMNGLNCSMLAYAHAPYHVTCAQGANFPQIFEIPDPDLFIHYATPRLYDQDKLSYLPKMCTALC